MAKRNASDASLSPQDLDSKAGKMQPTDLPNDSLEGQIGAVREQLKKDISTVSQKLGDLFATQSEAIDAIQFQGGFVESVSNRLLDLERKEKEKDLKINKLQSELFVTKEELGKVKSETRENTNERRSANMVVNGLRESTEEVPMNVALSFVQKLIPDFSKDLIMDSYRLGKSSKDGEVNRALFIKFRDSNVKMQVMKKKSALYKNKLLKMGSVYCNDDLTEDSRARRQEMREIARYANTIGFNDVKVVGNRLMVNGLSYQEDELHLLPTKLLLANVRTRKVRNGVGFHSKESYLSNFYATEVIINGKTFISAEQAYQYSKAVICGRDDIANAIMQCSDPKKIKHHGDRADVKKEWEDQKVNVMKCVVMGKFLQNGFIREKLLNTGSMPLFECTSNTFWGTGWRIESPQWANAAVNFPGNNQLGTILEEVRSLIGGGAREPYAALEEGFKNRMIEDLQRINPIKDTVMKEMEGAAGGDATIPTIPNSTEPTVSNNVPHPMLTKDGVENVRKDTRKDYESTTGKNGDAPSSSGSGADMMEYEVGSCVSVDSDLLSRSSFTAKSVLQDDGHLDH